MQSTTKLSSSPHLRNRYLSFSQVLASSLGVIGISGSVVIVIPLIFGNAGNGTCLTIILATIAYMLVAFQINVFARRIATVGSLYVFVEQGLGALAGTISGWALFIGYWGFAVVNAVAVPFYFLSFVRELAGITPSAPPTEHVIALACVVVALAWWLTYQGIKLSSRVILFIECITLSLIAVVIGGYFFSKGISVDTDQIHLTGVSFGSFSLGLVLALAAFTGFEASSVLGIEAKLPKTMIPRANILTILVAGSALVIASYALVQDFHALTPALDKDEAPLTTLSTSIGLAPLAPYIMGGVAFSWFGCLLGCFNTGGRLLYSLSHKGVFHKIAAKIHPQHNTPHIANGLIAGTSLVVALAFLIGGVGVMDIIDYLASFATFGFLIPYILVSVAALAYLKKQEKLSVKPKYIISAILAVALMMVALVGSIYPIPDWPLNIIPPVFFVCLASAVGYYIYIRRRRPHQYKESNSLIE